LILPTSQLQTATDNVTY